MESATRRHVAGPDYDYRIGRYRMTKDCGAVCSSCGKRYRHRFSFLWNHIELVAVPSNCFINMPVATMPWARLL